MIFLMTTRRRLKLTVKMWNVCQFSIQFHCNQPSSHEIIQWLFSSYFFLKNLLFFLLIGLVKVKLDLNIRQIGGDTVNVTWIAPNGVGFLTEAFKYDIKCYLCTDNACNETCNNVKYTPRQNNLTQTFVKVSNLQPGSKYVFRVYPKNSLNQVVGREKWNFTQSEPYDVDSTSKVSIVLVRPFKPCHASIMLLPAHILLRIKIYLCLPFMWRCPYENSTCYFTCEKHMELEQFSLMKFSFHTWSRNIFSYEIPNFVWNELVKNFTCDIL